MQPNLPYQAYRSKRHSRNISANSQPNLTPNVSPPPPSRPHSTTLQTTNGHGLTNSDGVPNGYTNGRGTSDPVLPLRKDFNAQPTFGVGANGHGSPSPERDSGMRSNGLSNGSSPANHAKRMSGDERRKSASMADLAARLQYESRRNTSPPAATSAATTSPASSSPGSRSSVPSFVSSSTPAPTSPPLPPLPASPTIMVSSPTSISNRAAISSVAAPAQVADLNADDESTVPGPSVVAATASTSSTASGSSSSTTPTPSPRTTRRTSTFRHVPLRPARAPHTSSPLRPASTLTSARQRTSSDLSTLSASVSPTPPSIYRGTSPAPPSLAAQTLGLKTPEMHALRLSDPPSRVSSLMSTPLLSAERELPAIPAFELAAAAAAAGEHPRSRHETHSSEPAGAHNFPHVVPPARSSSLTVLPPSVILAQSQTQTHTQTHANAPPYQVRSNTTPSSHSPSPSPSTPTARAHAPYRPGFQPKGVYRPRTDEFLEMRRTRRDDGRVERTRLERRLEKLIQLHFPHPDVQRQREKEKSEGKGKETVDGGRPGQNRRASSFFDLDLSSLRGKSASELWKGVLQTQAAAAGGKGDIRAAEQVITPWEDDAAVSQCPLCTSSFHPITNRKHHCRLCGRIMCSLPVKYPQRPQTCSLLFVADPMSGEIEEVGEGVDYGVRRRTSSTPQAPGKGKGRDEITGLNDDEKFLRGVRICRDCRPVLLRRQYTQEIRRIPLFTRLYDAFVALEKEIEDALPQFQELVISITHDERPSPEASAARKRLLDAFAQYDALAKRIRKLPCPGGPGSSQDRVQQAIVTRANVFLQKHMFPLQALPKPKKHSPDNAPSPSPSLPDAGRAQNQGIDPDSELAQALQPLLEQEALLESFVEEAKVHRKFEDAQTLKTNLKEIRAEIDRILANADVPLSESRPTPNGGGKGKKRKP